MLTSGFKRVRSNAARRSSSTRPLPAMPKRAWPNMFRIQRGPACSVLLHLHFVSSSADRYQCDRCDQSSDSRQGLAAQSTNKLRRAQISIYFLLNVSQMSAEKDSIVPFKAAWRKSFGWFWWTNQHLAFIVLSGSGCRRIWLADGHT